MSWEVIAPMWGKIKVRGRLGSRDVLNGRDR